MLSALGGNLSNARQSIAQVLNFALVLSTAFMLWKGVSIVSNSSSPIVVVLSGSMEPAFQRGDLLFLWNRAERTEVGEIVVYNVQGALCDHTGGSKKNYFYWLMIVGVSRQGHPHCPPSRAVVHERRDGQKECPVRVSSFHNFSTTLNTDLSIE